MKHDTYYRLSVGEIGENSVLVDSLMSDSHQVEMNLASSLLQVYPPLKSGYSERDDWKEAEDHSCFVVGIRWTDQYVPSVRRPFPRHSTHSLHISYRVRRQHVTSRLTLEALVWDHRIVKHLIVLIDDRLLVALANDFTGVTPTEVVH